MDQFAHHLGNALRRQKLANWVTAAPHFRHSLGRVSTGRWAYNADRLLNRHWLYPRSLHQRLRSGRDRFDLLHVIDHSYAHLALVSARLGVPSVVTCHDIDAFRSLIEPADDPDHENRPRWFRTLARRTLNGLRAASAVVCDSQATRQALERHRWANHGDDEYRLVVIAPGIADEFFRADHLAAQHVRTALQIGDDRFPIVAHVGSCIPRKRIDMVLEVFQTIVQAYPSAVLVKAGGLLSQEQRALAERLGVLNRLIEAPSLERWELAGLYRLASLVLQPSASEGFGLPVTEAIASGSLVLASDLPVLREAGGPWACYEPVGDLHAWNARALQLLLAQRIEETPHVESEGRSWARQRFTWDAHARAVAAVYSRVLGPRPGLV